MDSDNPTAPREEPSLLELAHGSPHCRQMGLLQGLVGLQAKHHPRDSAPADLTLPGLPAARLQFPLQLKQDLQRDPATAGQLAPDLERQLLRSREGPVTTGAAIVAVLRHRAVEEHGREGETRHVRSVRRWRGPVSATLMN